MELKRRRDCDEMQSAYRFVEIRDQDLAVAAAKRNLGKAFGEAILIPIEDCRASCQLRHIRAFYGAFFLAAF